MKKPLHPVSDHAVLRYLERVEGVDIEKVRRKIGRAVDVALDHPGATGVRVGAISFKLAGGVVTTVIEAHRPSTATGRVKRKRELEG